MLPEVDEDTGAAPIEDEAVEADDEAEEDEDSAEAPSLPTTGESGNMIPSPNTLAGTSWQLESLNDEAVDDTLMLVTFSPQRMDVSGDCMSFGADYQIEEKWGDAD